MKRVNFKRLSIQNFLSIGNEPVVIDFSKGLNIITGINLDKEGSKNGIGKSAICDAVNFCLFGETLRELKKEYISNRLSLGPCKVILLFEIIQNSITENYVLMRGINPTTIQLLYINGSIKKDITKSSIPKTTEYIKKLISCTPEVFQQSILMSINTTQPFMSQKKVEKRKFIEGILKLSVFSDLLNKVRLDYIEAKKDYDAETNLLDNTDKLLSRYNEQQQNIELSQKQEEALLNERIQNNENEINLLKSKLSIIDENEINELESNIKLLTIKEKEYNDKKYEILKKENLSNIEVTNQKNELKRLKKFGISCITCKRPFTKEDKIKYAQEISNIEDKIKQLTDTIKKYSNKEKEFDELAKKCNKAKIIHNDKLHQLKIDINNNENISDKISHINATIKHLKKDIKKLYTNKTDFKELIKETTDKRNLISKNINELQIKIDILEASKFVVSEEGVKAFIVKKILNLLNQRMMIYLSKLDGNCKCTFNEYFEETIIDEKGNECSYHNFSGGERKRIDLAILFTFQDIRRLQGDVSINLNMYDELLDSSLDAKGVEMTMQVLKEQIEKHDEAIYIITHNNFATDSIVQNVIELVKYNGITKLKQ